MPADTGAGRDQCVLCCERCENGRLCPAADRPAVGCHDMPSPRTIRGHFVSQFAYPEMSSGPPVVHETADNRVVNHELGMPAVRSDPGGTERIGMRHFGIWLASTRRMQRAVETVALPARLNKGVVIDAECRRCWRPPGSARMHGERSPGCARTHEQLDVYQRKNWILAVTDHPPSLAPSGARRPTPIARRRLGVACRSWH